MSLMNKITKNVENSLQEYTRILAEKFDLNQDSLLEIWNDMTKMKVRTKDAPKKRSAYQAFCAEQRTILKKQNPEISFGEISKITSTRWKALTAEQKAKYATVKKSTTPTPKTKSTPALKDLSKSQLLEKAHQMGIKVAKAKSKEFILKAIQDAEGNKGSEDEDSGSETASVTSASSSESSAVHFSTLVEEEDEGEENEEEDKMTMYKKMTCSELVQICKNKGLATTGSKEVLIRRLMN